MQFVRFDKVVDSLYKSMKALVDVYASQVLHDRPDLTGDGELKGPAVSS